MLQATFHCLDSILFISFKDLKQEPVCLQWQAPAQGPNRSQLDLNDEIYQNLQTNFI